MPSRFVSRAARVLRSFKVAQRGNVTILFAFSLLPMIGLTGLGVDYGIAFSAKTKLDNAADAAVLAAVSTAKAYVAANQTDASLADHAIAAGLDRARRAFAVNAGSLPFAAVPTPTTTLTRVKQTFSASASYSTSTVTQFGKLFGRTALTVAGLSSASADVPSYLDFYLLVDVSGSMGVPTSSADQATLASVNEGCQFACHFPDAKLATEATGKWGYNIVTTGYTKKKAADGSYQNDKKVLTPPMILRTGSVNNAICKLLSRALSPTVDNQYRVGIYPFITQVATLSGLTSDIVSLQNKADCFSTPPLALTSLLDTNVTQLFSGSDPTTGIGSGGTHFEAALPGMQALVSPIGDGSSALNAKPFVFMVTDGMQNGQRFTNQSGSSYRYVGNPNILFQSYVDGSNKPITANFVGGSSPQPIDPSFCSQTKTAGITLAVLYIPYVPLIVGTRNQAETTAANSAIPQLAASLRSCASPGFFYTATADADITASLDAMFNQAVQVAHLSQ